MEKFSTITDPEHCPIEELEAEVSRLDDLTEYYESMQLGIKEFLNSTYGACANKFFECYNLNVAEAITIQGQDLNHYSEDKVNEYFSGLFQNNEELHKELGIDHNTAKSFNFHADGSKTLAVYGDTDSIYVEFGRVVYACNVPEERHTQFVVDLWNKGCGPYIDNAYEEYSCKFQCTKNLQVLELEKIARTTILYAKKKYVMEECWKEPDIFLQPMEDMNYKGIEVIQGSTPSFARRCQKDFIEYTINEINHNHKPSYAELIDKLKTYRKELELLSPDEFAKSFAVGDYEKFILCDKGKLEIEKHCPAHVQGSGMYNMLLDKKKKYSAKYSRIRTGDKVKFYYADIKGNKDGNEMFAYLPNKFPLEFAPKVNYDKQFEKIILDPLNRLMEILGYNPVCNALCYSAALF